MQVPHCESWVEMIQKHTRESDWVKVLPPLKSLKEKAGKGREEAFQDGGKG
jgi:hypothetical protein